MKEEKLDMIYIEIKIKISYIDVNRKYNTKNPTKDKS